MPQNRNAPRNVSRRPWRGEDVVFEKPKIYTEWRWKPEISKSSSSGFIPFKRVLKQTKPCLISSSLATVSVFSVDRLKKSRPVALIFFPNPAFVVFREFGVQNFLPHYSTFFFSQPNKKLPYVYNFTLMGLGSKKDTDRPPCPSSGKLVKLPRIRAFQWHGRNVGTRHGGIVFFSTGTGGCCGRLGFCLLDVCAF